MRKNNKLEIASKEEKEKEEKFTAFQVAMPCHGCQPGRSLARRFGRSGLGWCQRLRTCRLMSDERYPKAKDISTDMSIQVSAQGAATTVPDT